MKNYSPKPDLWSKIQHRKDFDMQVKEHAPNLPERMPKADLWSAIESELDQKTPVIPLWKYGLAASIALILTLSSIAYLQFGDKEIDNQLISEVDNPVATPKVEEEFKPNETEPALEIPEAVVPEKITKRLPQNQISTRETTAPIEPPKLNLTDLRIENSFVSELIIPEIPEMQAVETLHKVRISWGIQDKSKLRTTFGAGAPKDISDKHLGRTEQSPNSIKIRFKKQ